ncbi:unnamed protein product [marine sediment metagenome]|uniref:Uncharacterized protein n=1 Tax=marine sediment metagenome TaxID=412755 RepID=X1NXD6_9ZZZZ
MWELTVARILREILVAGSARDWDKMIELAQELEELARSQKAILDLGADEFPGDGNPDENPG